MKKYVLVFPVLASLFFGIQSCSSDSEDITETETPVETVATTWQEHWYDHNQLVKNVYKDNSIAVYHDADMPNITWPNDHLKKVWDYSNATYGTLYGNSEDKKLYAIFHADKYGGGHASYYYDGSHDFRNVIDVGLVKANWNGEPTGNTLDILTHEVGHIVESASFNTRTSPAYTVWKDSKWAEIYIYDVYKNLGLTAELQRWTTLMNANTDDFPRANTHWFKDWFFPIYNNYGGTQVLSKFFKLMSQNFPKDANGKYTREMNWGEFIHFWSGASGTNLKTLATNAFGWTATMDAQFIKAKTDFPAIVY